MSAFLRRIPNWAQIIPVYGVIIIIVYTWTLMHFFWKVPSWLYFLNGGEVTTLLAYSLITNFAESILVLCGLLFLAFVLPRKWFRDVFVARGASLAIAGLGYIIFLGEKFNNQTDYPTLSLPILTVLGPVVGIGLLVYLFGRVPLLRKVAEAVADRMSIFAYILAPLSIISLLFVLIRSVVR